MNDKIRKVIWITVVVIAIGWAYHLFSGPLRQVLGSTNWRTVRLPTLFRNLFQEGVWVRCWDLCGSF